MVVPHDSAGSSEPSPLSLDEPAWQSDRDCPACSLCSCRFSLSNRRHHCRRCGVCACSDCCQHRLPLPRMGFVDPVLHCQACAEATRAEAGFYGRQIRLLIAGCTFELSLGGSAAGVFVCRLATDQRCALSSGFPQSQSAHQSKPSPTAASSLPCGIRICWRNSSGESVRAELSSRRPETQRATLAWVSALQTATEVSTGRQTAWNTASSHLADVEVGQGAQEVLLRHGSIALHQLEHLIPGAVADAPGLGEDPVLLARDPLVPVVVHRLEQLLAVAGDVITQRAVDHPALLRHVLVGADARAALPRPILSITALTSSARWPDRPPRRTISSPMARKSSRVSSPEPLRFIRRKLVRSFRCQKSPKPFGGGQKKQCSAQGSRSAVLRISWEWNFNSHCPHFAVLCETGRKCGTGVPMKGKVERWDRDDGKNERIDMS
uniref:FYVE-type domain-containing protein n=1 Tax=Macrostomum lignano TaxID=282301 RepID=A0A1I8JQM0_9PLAT